MWVTIHDLGSALTIEWPWVDPPENPLGWKSRVHGISEPIRQDEQKQRRHGQGLRLEVIDLRKDARNSRQTLGKRGKFVHSRSKGGESKTEEERPESQCWQLRLVSDGQDL